MGDDSVGLYYLKNRHYHPELCRFLQADTVLGRIGAIGSHNLYSYCQNAPVNHMDPDGRDMDSVDGGGGITNAIGFAVIGAGIATNLLFSSNLFDNSPTLTNSSYTISFSDEVLRLEESLAQYKKVRGYEEHHIVPKAAKGARYAREIVESALVGGVENKSNKVYLPQSVHHRMHTNAYYFYINAQMFKAYFQSMWYGTPLEKEVEEELESIKVILMVASFDEY